VTNALVHCSITGLTSTRTICYSVTNAERGSGKVTKGTKENRGIGKRDIACFETESGGVLHVDFGYAVGFRGGGVLL
jgi:hypothetical protein